MNKGDLVMLQSQSNPAGQSHSRVGRDFVYVQSATTKRGYLFWTGSLLFIVQAGLVGHVSTHGISGPVVELMAFDGNRYWCHAENVCVVSSADS